MVLCWVRFFMLVFVVMLGYSCMMFVIFVLDEFFEFVWDFLLLVFDYLGGVFCEVLFDNMKIVVLECDVYGDGKYCFYFGLF